MACLTPRARPGAAALEQAAVELQRSLGVDRVCREPEVLEGFATDASGDAYALPDLLVRAETPEHVVATLAVANTTGVPVTPRGAGTGKSGGAVPIRGGIVLALDGMRSRLEIDPENMCAHVDAGVITGDLMRAAEAEGLFYPPDPNSWESCTLGGNIATNAGGPRALKYGVTRRYVLELGVVTAAGTRMRLGQRTLKGVAGFDLVGLVVGSEGTLAVVTDARLRLLPLPRGVACALATFLDAETACRAVTRVMRAGVTPRTLELLDRRAVDALRAGDAFPFGASVGAALILETDGEDASSALASLERSGAACVEAGALDVQVAHGPAQRERIWAPRRALSETLRRTADRKISEDVAVPRARLPELMREVEAIGARHGVRTAAYGHAGDGNLHVNILFDADQEAAARSAAWDVMRSSVQLGGTISGEHGVGLTKQAFLALEQSTEVIRLQQQLKAVFDPKLVLNPDKIFPSRGVRE